MTLKNFSFFSALKFALLVPFKRPLDVLKVIFFFLIFLAIALCAAGLSAIILSFYRTESGQIQVMGSQLLVVGPLMALIWSVVLGFWFYTWSGITRASLHLVRDLPLQIKDMFLSAHEFFVYVKTALAFNVAYYLGTLALVIPGIYVALSYGYSKTVAVDRQYSIADSFGLSRNMVFGSKLKLLVTYFFLGMIIAAISGIPLAIMSTLFPIWAKKFMIVANLILIPVGLLLYAIQSFFFTHIYQQLLDQTEKIEQKI